jgi:hypothetical protein
MNFEELMRKEEEETLDIWYGKEHKGLDLSHLAMTGSYVGSELARREREHYEAGRNARLLQGYDG